MTYRFIPRPADLGRRSAPRLFRWGWIPVALMLALGAGCGSRMFLYVTPVVLAKDLRVYLGGGGNTLALLHRGEALVVDPKTGDATLRVRHEVQEELGRRVRRILLTHHHAAHSGGLGAFREVGAVLVHPRSRARLEDHGEKNAGWQPAWVEVDREVGLLLGEEEVRVLHLGVGHTDGDLVALLPARKLLLAGDLFLNGYEPWCDVTAGGNLLELRRTLERVLALPFEQVLPGHGELGTREQVQRYRDYLVEMEAQVRRAIARGLEEEQVARAVTLPEYGELRPLPLLGTDRAGNVRQMFRAVKEGDKSPRP